MRNPKLWCEGKKTKQSYNKCWCKCSYINNIQDKWEQLIVLTRISRTKNRGSEENLRDKQETLIETRQKKKKERKKSENSDLKGQDQGGEDWWKIVHTSHIKE